MTTPRFKIAPRDVPPSAVARLLGVSEARFVDFLPHLFERGFPSPDATTGSFDLKAVENWQDRRSGLASSIVSNIAKDAGSVVGDRLKAMRHG